MSQSDLKKQVIALFTEQNLSKSEISRQLNLSRTTVRRWLLEATPLSTDKDDMPLSETAIPKIHVCTKQEALDDLRKLAEDNPDLVISRNYYRVHGKYSEAAWNLYFGTFHEYKRQAGIVLTRQQHAMEQKIAKHASVDHYRDMSNERLSYADTYTVKNSNQYQKVVIASDLHDKNVDQFYLKVLLDTLKRVQPDVVVLAGDIFDLPEFSKYTVDPRDWDVVGRIKYAHENILKPIREICPNAQLDFIEGNHEFRLLKHLADATPALRAVLSDLHGMTVAGLLGLDKFKINYIAKGDLSAYSLQDQHKEVAKNYKVYFDSFIVGHELPAVKNLGYPTVTGHHHKTEIESNYNEHFGCFSHIQIGGGHQLDAEYCHPKWNLGFAIAICDTHTKQTSFETVTFTESMAVVGGKVYVRGDK